MGRTDGPLACRHLAEQVRAERNRVDRSLRRLQEMGQRAYHNYYVPGVAAHSKCEQGAK